MLVYGTTCVPLRQRPAVPQLGVHLDRTDRSGPDKVDFESMSCLEFGRFGTRGLPPSNLSTKASLRNTDYRPNRPVRSASCSARQKCSDAIFADESPTWVMAQRLDKGAHRGRENASNVRGRDIGKSDLGVGKLANRV